MPPFRQGSCNLFLRALLSVFKKKSGARKCFGLSVCIAIISQRTGKKTLGIAISTNNIRSCIAGVKNISGCMESVY